MRVELRGVSVTLGSRALFADLTHSFSGTGTIALLGPSGSGKSTLLGLIAHELRPDSGEIRWVSPGIQEPRFSWIFQNSPLLQRRTAVDNVMLGPLLAGEEIGIARARATQAMGTLGITGLAKMPVHRLSGGEKQRVAVARSMAAEARLLLADEPTASLDPESRKAVGDALNTAADGGALVIVATHDVWLAENCTLQVRIERGLLVT